MNYTLGDVSKAVAEQIDAIYLINESENKYQTLKDCELFHDIFGESGSYSEMMFTFFDRTIDKRVASGSPYGAFLKGEAKFTGTIGNNARMRIDDREVTIAVWKIDLDEYTSALMISEQKEDEYIQDIHKDQQMNAIKSAYLFSMNVDLNKNTCENMGMSEISDIPISQIEVTYTEWRNMIKNMFLPQDQDMFLEVTDPQFLRANLQYGVTKSIDCEMMNLEGQFIWVKLIFNRIDTGNDEDFRFFFMVENIHESHTRLMDDLRKFEKMASHDSLTGLMNHGTIESEINSSIGKCRKEGKPVSLIMFDINYFKQVNDTYGHASGDYVLKIFSGLASDSLMEYGGKLGRWGGEEFLGICENVAEERMYEIAENLRQKIENYNFDAVGHITSSIGVIEVGKEETSTEAFHRIDAALYEAKNNGRNNVVRG